MLLSLKAKICALSVLTVCLGCSVHQVTGDTMTGYTRQHLIPYLMKQGDLDTACGIGLSMGAFLNSFERVIDSPHRAAVPTLISAASCFEEAAWQAELKYLRAVGKAQVSEATDARIIQQLAHGKAATALYTAYKRMRMLFAGEGTACPDLSSDEDQLLWLLGHIAGIQAVQHDGAGGRTVEVPQDIPVKAMRAMACLDNEKWWGMPKATQAAVWIIVPGSNEGYTDAQGKTVEPFQALRDSLKVSAASEIRSAFAIAGMVYENGGKTVELKSTIEEFAKLTANGSDHAYQLLEQVARR
ncbi:MAG: hypothetical protein ACPGQS_14850, partial [Bradymonadia bacterium]